MAGSITVLGAALTLAAGGIVESQTPKDFMTAQATPATAPAQILAAADQPLRDDQVQLLAAALDQVEAHGFRPGEFAAADVKALLRSGEPGARERGEALLKKAIVAYAKAQHGGRILKADSPNDWGIDPQPYDAQADFNFALSQNKLAQWVASLPPPFERYRQLKTALAQYRAIAARGGWDPIPEGPALKPGMSDPRRVPLLRKRLAAENPPGSIETESPVYDARLAAVVAAAQARYGLAADGVVGSGTLAAFNTPVEGRIQQIAANMERWRWMPRQGWPATRIEVNVAGAQLTVYDENRPIDQMKVVVGAPDKKTPMLISEIHSVVFNPPWNVPNSIATKELLPKGPDYLASKGFRWVKNGNGGSRLQQKPGPGNSLGRIKFDFKNPYGVYLHDTNAKSAFGLDERSISHGCVRVERPEELADMLLGADPRWSDTKLQEVLSDTDTVRASLPSKVPVMLLYWTVFVTSDGQVNFRDDIYDWDKDLSSLLDSGRIAA